MNPSTQVTVAPSIHEMTKNLRWKPKYDRLVFMRIDGKTLEEMSEETGLCASRCSIVLNSEEGQKRLIEYTQRIREGAFERIERRMVRLGETAVANLEQTLQAEVNPGSKKKIHQDKMSFELLDRIGFSKKRETGGGGEEGSKVREDLAERLVTALEKSVEADRIAKMPIEAEAEPVSE